MKQQSFVDMLRAVDDAGLDPYEFRLWVHIWRVGVSWESLRTIAKKCNMSVGKAQQARKALVERNMLAYGESRGRLGLTAIVSQTVVYVHQVNADVHDMNADVHDMNADVHVVNAILSKPNEVSKKKRNNMKQKDVAAAADTSNPVLPILQEYGVAVNKTTTGLLDLDPQYVAAHLRACSRNREKIGLAIRRMLDGDPAPTSIGQVTSYYIPPELADIIRR